MPAVKARACKILAEFSRAQAEVIGKTVILTSGEAGTVENVWLDELHGLRISLRGHDGRWPVSMIKFASSMASGGESVRQEMIEMPHFNGADSRCLLATYTYTYTRKPRIVPRTGHERVIGSRR